MVEALARLAGARTMEALIASALEVAPRLAAADAVGVYLFDGDQLAVHARGVCDRAIANYLALPPGADPLIARMQETGAPVHDGSVFAPDEWRAHPLYVQAAAPFGFEHYLVAPIVGRSGIAGALTLARSERARGFAEADLTAVSNATTHLSVALAHLRQCDRCVEAAISSLSTRERNIAVFTAKGLTNVEIARHLCVSENTIKKNLKAMFVKLDVSTRAELAWLATVGGIV